MSLILEMMVPLAPSLNLSKETQSTRSRSKSLRHMRNNLRADILIRYSHRTAMPTRRQQARRRNIYN